MYILGSLIRVDGRICLRKEWYYGRLVIGVSERGRKICTRSAVCNGALGLRGEARYTPNVGVDLERSTIENTLSTGL